MSTLDRVSFHQRTEMLNAGLRAATRTNPLTALLHRILSRATPAPPAPVRNVQQTGPSLEELRQLLARAELIRRSRPFSAPRNYKEQARPPRSQ